jgi:hypothetical protein
METGAVMHLPNKVVQTWSTHMRWCWAQAELAALLLSHLVGVVRTWQSSTERSLTPTLSLLDLSPLLRHAADQCEVVR